MRKGTYIRWIATKHILKSEIRNNMSIIDLGGFDGSISAQIKNYFSQTNFLVVDKNREGLKIAKKKGLNILYSDALDINAVLNNSIDLILCFYLLEHVDNDKKLIYEISRILKKNGKIILTTPMKEGIIFPFVRKEISREINKKWGHLRFGYSIKEIKKLLKERGIIIEYIDKYFNWFSKFAYYWLDYFSIVPIFLRRIIFRLIVNLEPYIKIRSNEHIIIGRKIKE